jgi:aminoglycoside phosphotransferase (APT) family kinase protein
VDGRTVTVVVVDGAGEPVGTTEPFTVANPWWNEVASVVDGVRRTTGMKIAVLRLLTVGGAAGTPAGRQGSYAAELMAVRPDDSDRTHPPRISLARLRPTSVGERAALADHPQRQTYARPGGPASEVDWARRQLDRIGVAVTGPAEQVRTWNLSALWRIPVAGPYGPWVWLKVVPPFFAHEGAALALVARDHPARVPHLLATEGPRVLMAHIDGSDLYDADRPTLDQIADAAFTIVRTWHGRADELAALLPTAPDWRGPHLVAAAADVVSRTPMPAAEGEILAGLVERLPDRLDRIAACGIADGLVHGDAHSGNARRGADGLRILDWGDCGIGHPLLDLPAFFEPVADPADHAWLRDRWLARWAEAVPGSDPGRAAALLAPIAALRQATVYRRFLDEIEPSERCYHEADPPAWLARAAALARAEATD